MDIVIMIVILQGNGGGQETRILVRAIGPR
jgi:hypothetical protein